MGAFGQSASGADLGIDSMSIIASTGAGALGNDLQQTLKDQEDERKKKLMQLGGTVSLAAQALLDNSTGGFGG